MSRRPYLREIPKTSWFLRQPRYLRYMAREITCIFIGAYALLMIVGLVRLVQGRDAWTEFAQSLAGPLGTSFLAATLAFSVYHTVSWFNVTPKAMPVLVGDRFLPGGIIVGAHYAGWVALSLAILTLSGAI